MIEKVHNRMNEYSWRNYHQYYDGKDRANPLKVSRVYISEKRFKEAPYFRNRYWVVEFENGRKRYEDSYGNGVGD